MAIRNEVIPLDRLLPDERNPKLHCQENIRRLVSRIQAVGFTAPVLVDERTGILAGGHRRRLALLWLRENHFPEPDGVEPGWGVPARVGSWTELQALQVLIGDNEDPVELEYDDAALTSLLAELQAQDALEGAGYDEGRLEELIEELAECSSPVTDGRDNPAFGRRALAERFGVPPFSVLDARQGYWQERKQVWLALGIQSELGRTGNTPGLSEAINEQHANGTGPLARSSGPRPHGKDHRPVGETGSGRYRGGDCWRAGSHPNTTPSRPLCSAAKPDPDGRTQRGDGRCRGFARAFGQDLMRGEHVVGVAGLTWVTGRNGGEHLDATSGKILNAQPLSGTSIFDPVLCELVYRWFSPTDAVILDPFAGGSVRGIVAGVLNRNYVGIDLRPEQIAANEQQARDIEPAVTPRWVSGDSRNVAVLAPGEYDLLFSCPPYADLERYSDDPRDLSTLDYPAFMVAYRGIISASVTMLQTNRFAVFVVGDVRDKRGFYRRFVADTIVAFADAGMELYNDAVLVTVCGSLPLRVGTQFGRYRKLGKTHQNVLVFYKGDPKKIPTFMGGDCEYGDLSRVGSRIEVTE